MVQSWLLCGREKWRTKNVFWEDAVGGGWGCRKCEHQVTRAEALETRNEMEFMDKKEE